MPQPVWINNQKYWKSSEIQAWIESLQTADERKTDGLDPFTGKPVQWREDPDDLQAKAEAKAKSKAEMRAKREDSEETPEAESAEEVA